MSVNHGISTQFWRNKSWYLLRDTESTLGSITQGLIWFGHHVVIVKVPLANTILLGHVDGKRSRGRPARQWMGNVTEWTELSSNEMWREPEDGVTWRKNRQS